MKADNYDDDDDKRRLLTDLMNYSICRTDDA